MTEIFLTTAIRAPAERCFDLARSIDHHVESMRGTDERAVAGVTSGLIGMGEEVTWEARHFGLRLRLTSRITAYQRPYHFQDSMVAGPFASFVHDHHFLESPWGTVMRDQVQFRCPPGVIGALLDWFLVEPHLRRLLTKRNLMLKRVAESQTGE